MGGSWFPETYKTEKWRPPELSALPSWAGVKRLGLDCETKDTDLQALGPGVRRPGNYMVGVSFAIEDGPKHYLPFAHEGGDNLPKENVLAYLKDQFKTFDGDVVGANLPYDLDWLWEAGILMPKVHRFRDVQVADPLIYELHDKYSLEAICERWGIPGKNEDALREAAGQMKLDPKRDLWKLPSRHVGAYAEDDAERPLKILREQEKRIEADGIEECWDMECRVLPVLLRMQRRGVRVDEARLDRIEEWTKIREAEYLDIVKRETGVTIPVGQLMNVDLLARALRAADLPVGTNTKGDSVTKELLATLDHPVAKAITKARQVSTLRTTFVAGTRKHLTYHTGEARLHCTFNQIRKTDDEGDSSGVAYGRLSASHPNMQNQPGNSRFSGDNEVGPMWRSIYMAEHGQMWCANDLKQQEPKWSFHYGAILEELGIEGVTGAVELCKRLTADPSLDTYEPIVQVAGVPRPTAKIMWLARCYGQGDGTLCEGLGLPTCEVTFHKGIYNRALNNGDNKYEAKRKAVVRVDSPEGQEAIASGSFTWKGAGDEGAVIIEKFDTEMPFLRVCADIAKQKANEVGYVKLLSGRRCHFEKSDKGRGYEWTHKAFNRIIQGTSAEQTKRIMLAVAETEFEAGMILQVHDELDFSLDSVEAALACADVMKSAVPMKVPTVVDTECGPSWGESMGVEYKDAQGKKQKTTYRWGMKIVNGEPVQFKDILDAKGPTPADAPPSDDLQLIPGGQADGRKFLNRAKVTT